MLLIQRSQRRSVQPSGHSVTVHVYRLLMRPWAMHWTQAAPEGVTPADRVLGPSRCVDVSQRDMQRISNYAVCTALNSRVKLHLTLKRITPRLRAHHTRAELLRFIRVTHLLRTLFSFLALCGFLNLTCRVCFEAWQCGKSTPAFTLWRVLLLLFFPWTLGAFNKNIS